MTFLQSYQESISYESSGVIPKKNKREDPTEEKEDDTLRVDEIWKFVESGPKKGKVIPELDKLGNVIVDPAGNILKEQYLLDFNEYKQLHNMANKNTEFRINKDELK